MDSHFPGAQCSPNAWPCSPNSTPWSGNWKRSPTKSPNLTMQARSTPTWPTVITSLEHEFRTRDGYSIEAEVGRVLMGLGFRKEDWERQTDEFSGGWQMRLALAKLLLRKNQTCCCWTSPQTILTWRHANWLEEYLHDYPYALVLISHDRLLSRCHGQQNSRKIWNTAVLVSTPATTTNSWRRRRSAIEQLQAAYRNQRDRIEQLEVFINRFRRIRPPRPSRFRAASKKLEKNRADRDSRQKRKTIHFSFPQPKPSGPHCGRVRERR